jgi:hypothetical protein
METPPLGNRNFDPMRGWSTGARRRRLGVDYGAIPYGRQGGLLGEPAFPSPRQPTLPPWGGARTGPSPRRSAAGVRRRMDGEDRLEQRAIPSRLTGRWECPHALRADPGRAVPARSRARGDSRCGSARVSAVGVLARGLAPPAAPRDPSESDASIPCVHACGPSGRKPAALGPLLRDAHMSSGTGNGLGVRRGH